MIAAEKITDQLALKPLDPLFFFSQICKRDRFSHDVIRLNTVTDLIVFSVLKSERSDGWQFAVRRCKIFFQFY